MKKRGTKTQIPRSQPKQGTDEKPCDEWQKGKPNEWRTIRIRTALLNEIEGNMWGSTGAKGAAIERFARRTNEVLEKERIPLRRTFSEEECALMIDACDVDVVRGIDLESQLPSLIERHLAYMDEDKKAASGVDGNALLEKLRGLTPGQFMALVVTIEKWLTLALLDGREIAPERLLSIDYSLYPRLEVMKSDPERYRRAIAVLKAEADALTAKTQERRVDQTLHDSDRK